LETVLEISIDNRKPLIQESTFNINRSLGFFILYYNEIG